MPPDDQPPARVLLSDTAERRWFEPTPVGRDADAARLTAEQVASWREQGFCLVDGLLPDDLVDAVRADAAAFFPEPGSDAAAAMKGFGSGQRFVFPSPSAEFNAITLHPDLLRAVADLLGVAVPDLRLTQSDLWPKYGRPPSGEPYDNADQRIHCDYPNHMLTHPSPWDAPDAVEMIVYLDDVDDCEGPTALVAREGEDDPAYAWPIMAMPGVEGLDYINDREKAEAYLREHAPEKAAFRAAHLYPREACARYRAGTALLYRHDVWHRGTVARTGTRRLAMNLTFKRADVEWINIIHVGWAWSAYHLDHHLEQLIGAASVDQRTVMGFPAPRSRYWNNATLEAVNARFAPFGFDPTPYEM
jgi:hypothetical protein